MTIEKLPSGNYRIKQMYNGKTYRLTVDHRPTKKEAEELMNELLRNSGHISTKNMTFTQAVNAYCAMKSNILSPSTIVGYKKSLRQLSPLFSDTMLNDLDQFIIQKEINDLSGRLSPKTVRNAHGLIAAILKTYRNGLTFRINLPQKQVSEPHIPTEEDINRILDYMKDTDYWVPFELGILGMRRSEICALTPADLSDDNMLTINKGKVQNEHKEWIIKPFPKTEESNRIIYVPAAVADRIRTQGYVFEQHPERLLDHLHQAQKDLGIESFRFHDLRHFYASMAHAMGIPDKYIQKQGGWKTDIVMKNVYRHAMEEELKMHQKAFAERFL